MKSEKKPDRSNVHTQQHKKIVSGSPIVVVSTQNPIQLQQPSLLKSVNSITTYEVTCNIKE